MRRVLEVRHDSLLDAAYVELVRDHCVATAFTDFDRYPSLADITDDFIYARLMRTHQQIDTGYPPEELDDRVRRTRAWSRGEGSPGTATRCRLRGRQAW